MHNTLTVKGAFSRRSLSIIFSAGSLESQEELALRHLNGYDKTMNNE